MRRGHAATPPRFCARPRSRSAMATDAKPPSFAFSRGRARAPRAPDGYLTNLSRGFRGGSGSVFLPAAAGKKNGAAATADTQRRRGDFNLDREN